MILQVTETNTDLFKKKKKVDELVGLLLGREMRDWRLRLETGTGTKEAGHTLEPRICALKFAMAETKFFNIPPHR